jgi:sugar phosphate permease
MVTDLMRELHMDALAFASMSAAFSISYIAMQLPVGVLVDRFGCYRLLLLNALLCGLACWLFSMATNPELAAVARFMMGFSASFAFVGSLKLAAVWFPPQRFGFLSGLTQTLGMVGASIGDAPMAWLVDKIGWRGTMQVVAITFLGLSLLIALLVRDVPQSGGQQTEDTQEKKPDYSIMQGVRVVFANPQSWLISLYSGLVYAPSAVFAELWGVSFINSAYDISREKAAAIVGCIFLGWIIGGPLSGWVSDTIGKRKPLMMFSSLMGILIMAIVIFVPNLSMNWLFVLMFVFGMTNFGVATSYAVAAELNPRGIAGTSLALTNMASVIVGYALQPVVGKLLDLGWDKRMVQGAPFFSAETFQQALFILPLCSLLSALVLLWVKETHCRSVDP